MLCIPKLRIAILNEELALWEKRLSDKPELGIHKNYPEKSNKRIGEKWIKL